MIVDAEAAAAGTLFGFVVKLLILVFGLRVLFAESLTVETPRETRTVLLNHNATIPCFILGSSQLNTTIMAVTWFRKNRATGTDVKVFEFVGNHQKAFRSGASVSLEGLAKGDASLHLLEVQLWEAGEYRCEVVNTPDKGQGTVVLEVVACPRISLSLEESKGKDNDVQRLRCKASGSYPKDVNITWCKWNQENAQCLAISENITTNGPVRNEDDTFNVSSILGPKLPLEHNATYQCQVEHVSCTQWSNNITLTDITLPENGSETKSYSLKILWIIIPCLAAVLVLIVAVSRWKRFCSPQTVAISRPLTRIFIEEETPKAFIHDRPGFSGGVSNGPHHAARATSLSFAV